MPRAKSPVLSATGFLLYLRKLPRPRAYENNPSLGLIYLKNIALFTQL
jgi:hypothetical protein